MATGYGAWVFTDDYRAIVDASVSNTNNTTCTVYVDGKMQSQYAGGSYWSGNATSDANGGTSSSGTFACSAGQTKTFKSNSFTVSRGTSAKTITCKATVFGGGGTYANTSSTASVNVTVPAKPSYSVTYNANGGSGAPGGQTKWYGDDLTLSSTKPTRTGYTFKGWATSSSSSTVAYAAGAKYTGNAALSLYAVWQALTYSVGYNANGGTGAPASQTKTYGTALTLSSTKPTRAASVDATFTVTYNANGGSVSPSSATSKKRTNYTFKNWNTAANGSGTAYNPGASYSANAAATLYAQWNSSPATDPVTLPRPTRANHTFNGWYTAATGGSRIGAAGASYTPTASIQIFAQWTLDYAAPTLGTFTAVRCNADGTANDNGAYVSCTLKWTNGNKAPQSVKFAVTGTSYSATVSTSATATTASALLGGALSTELRYTVTATLTDAMPKAYSAQTILTPSFFTIDFLQGGRGVAIGQAASKQEFEVSMPTEIHDTLVVDGAGTFGSLKANSGAVTLRDTRLDRDGTAPSSTQWSRVIGIQDKDEELVGYIQAAQFNDGRIQLQILACNEKSDGTQANNSFGLIVAKDGTTSYSITNPTALRTALGKYTRSSVGALDWGTNNDYLIAKSALAYWNGAYSGTTSNLTYCNKGAFGSFATKNSLAAADIPNLDAGKITSGTVARARIENTAWAYLVGSASTVASGNYVRWRMVAGIVFLQVYYRSGAGLTAGSAKSIGNIPANYRPSSVVESTGYLGANNASPCDIWVETNGNAYIITATAASSKFYGTLSYPLG